MKKSYKIITLLIIALGFGIMLNAKADSGWDYDYDSGSSWDSGSNWDSSSSWDSSYDSGYSYSSGSGSASIGMIFLDLIILITVIIIIYSITKNKMKQPISYSSSNKYEDISFSQIEAIDKDFDIAKFKEQAFNIYKDIQYAWSNFEYDKIRKLTTDELYNMYTSQLKVLKAKKQRNIMSDIDVLDVKIIGIKEENKVITVQVYLCVSCYDYVILESDNKTVRGTDKNKVKIEYELAFIKAKDDNKNIEKCPNCGASVDINASATCPYCDSTLVKVASDYVLSKKKTVGQSIMK